MENFSDTQGGRLKISGKMANTLDITDVDDWFKKRGRAEFRRWRAEDKKFMSRLRKYPPLFA